MQKRIKAVALISGGLDSILAAKIIKDQGIDVLGLSFTFKFDSVKHGSRKNYLEKVEKELNIPIKIMDRSQQLLDIVKNPVHGYGSEMNPCIDCRLQMLSMAKDYMDETNSDFIVTGEVVGQRPMSQQKPVIFHIDKVSGLRGYIVRPLSAKLLPETIPEQKGWIKREELYDFHGRTRKPQLSLARELGIENFEPPAGGCSLTTPDFSRRLKALFEKRDRHTITVNDLQLLLYGRHFWPNEHLNVIVGRDEKDNEAIEKFKGIDMFLLYPFDIPGPSALAIDVKNREDLNRAASLVARYTNQRESSSVEIIYSGKEEGRISVLPAGEDDVEEWRV
ncbi:7-cyano-7-deazaguanine synthase [bacterium]|nr:7-cyano-7-deazaguanine synthase [bacterium]